MSRINIPTGGAGLLSQTIASQQQSGLGALTSILNNRTENLARSGELLAQLIQQEKDRELAAVQFNAKIQQAEQERIAQAFLQGQQLAAGDIANRRSIEAEEGRFKQSLEQRQVEAGQEQEYRNKILEGQQTENISAQRDRSAQRQQQQSQFQQSYELQQRELDSKLKQLDMMEPFIRRKAELDIQSGELQAEDLQNRIGLFGEEREKLQLQKQELEETVRKQKLTNDILGSVGESDAVKQYMRRQLFGIPTDKDIQREDLDLSLKQLELEERKKEAANPAGKFAEIEQKLGTTYPELITKFKSGIVDDKGVKYADDLLNIDQALKDNNLGGIGIFSAAPTYKKLADKYIKTFDPEKNARSQIRTLLTDFSKEELKDTTVQAILRSIMIGYEEDLDAVIKSKTEGSFSGTGLFGLQRKSEVEQEAREKKRNAP